VAAGLLQRADGVDTVALAGLAAAGAILLAGALQTQRSELRAGGAGQQSIVGVSRCLQGVCLRATCWRT
jgi:hypothetical protein